jgi:cysteinyl-tRNA synthetase
MVLKFFNSLGNKIEAFKPIKEGNIGLYTCGPTVYNYAHIGNFRAYVWEDILKRYLKFKGYNVKHIMNLTDVDDKTIKGSKEQGVPLNEYTSKYKKAFFEDLKILNIDLADEYPEATETIGEMVDLIQKLLDKGYAYRGEDNCIYFSIKKFPEYGKLANIDVTKLKAGARISADEYEKEGVGDFALWKAWDENDGGVFWETKLGKGRPGWHIECSAMSSKYLGESFDIHTGGVDNKFPHHENEIAQSEAANGKKFVNYWMHCEHLMVDGKKMSKSLGNFYTLRDLIEKNINPKAIRFTLANSNYRQPLNFTIESVKDNEKTVKGIQNFVDRLKTITNKIENDSIKVFVDKAQEGFENAMDEDLNVPLAMSFIFEFQKEVNKLIDNESIGKTGANEALNFMKKIDSVIGVIDFTEKYFELTEEQEKLVEERNKARSEKNWELADKLRDELKEQGILVIDNKDGTTTTKPIE